MTTPRSRITTIKEFQMFLRQRGFSRREALIISVAGWRVLERGEKISTGEGVDGSRIAAGSK